MEHANLEAIIGNIILVSYYALPAVSATHLEIRDSPHKGRATQKGFPYHGVS